MVLVDVTVTVRVVVAPGTVIVLPGAVVVTAGYNGMVSNYPV